MTKSNPQDWLNLDKETLEAQRATRNVVKRDTRILMLAMLGGPILLFGLSILLSQNWPVFLMPPFLLAIYVISNWRQWNALLTFNLRCPHCGRPLAERVKLFRSPNHNCPHCGQRALATIKQLKHQDTLA